MFSQITTSIHAVDTDPDKGENEYFLTINLGPFPEGSILFDLGATPPTTETIAASGLTLIPDNVTNYTFTALEIDSE